MKFGVKYRPSYALLGVSLEGGEEVLVEAGSMVSMSADMGMTTKLSATGGFFKALITALGRKFLGGETTFINIFKAGDSGGQILIAPAMNGDIIHFPLQGNRLLVQASSFLASSPDISVKLRFGGLRTLLGGEGLFLLAAEGTGDLFVNSFGAIKEMDINGSFVVDTGHIVAFEDSLEFNVKRVGSWKSTFFSGEGLVTEFNGQGKLYLQTRNIGALTAWLSPMLPS